MRARSYFFFKSPESINFPHKVFLRMSMVDVWDSGVNGDKTWEDTESDPQMRSSISFCNGTTYKCRFSGTVDGKDQYSWQRTDNDDSEQSHAKCYEQSIRAIAETHRCLGGIPEYDTSKWQHNWNVNGVEGQGLCLNDEQNGISCYHKSDQTKPLPSIVPGRRRLVPNDASSFNKQNYEVTPAFDGLASCSFTLRSEPLAPLVPEKKEEEAVVPPSSSPDPPPSSSIEKEEIIPAPPSDPPPEETSPLPSLTEASTPAPPSSSSASTSTTTTCQWFEENVPVARTCNVVSQCRPEETVDQWFMAAMNTVGNNKTRIKPRDFLLELPNKLDKSIPLGSFMADVSTQYMTRHEIKKAFSTLHEESSDFREFVEQTLRDHKMIDHLPRCEDGKCTAPAEKSYPSHMKWFHGREQLPKGTTLNIVQDGGEAKGFVKGEHTARNLGPLIPCEEVPEKCETATDLGTSPVVDLGKDVPRLSYKMTIDDNDFFLSNRIEGTVDPVSGTNDCKVRLCEQNQDQCPHEFCMFNNGSCVPNPSSKPLQTPSNRL